MTELIQEELPKKEQGITKLQIDQIQYHLERVNEALGSMKKIQEISSEQVQEAEKQIANFALSLRSSKLAPEHLEAFFKKPYFLTPARKESWYLYVPRFIDIQIGYLEYQDEAWNKFLINRYAEWLGGIPESLKKELGLKTPLELKLEGDILFGSVEAQEEAWKKYKPFLRERTKEGIKVNQKRAFELIAALVKDGVLPFSIRQIDSSYFIETENDFELRDYQKDAWEVFKKYSNVGIFWPPSAGKTFFTLYAISHLKGPHLIVVPNIILKEQWEERIALHCPQLKEDQDYVVSTYQTAINKLMERQWTGFFIDECQHLPANSFAKLSMVKRLWTVGLTATPQREDGREEYIFALTGKPVGLSWDSLKKLGVIKSPTCHVWIVKNDDTRYKKLGELLQDEKKTIIFCDNIEPGKLIASRFNIPFISGETKIDRLKTVQENQTVVMSRVGDQGISIPDIARVIEVKWLFGSRRQELQRFGRLLHGNESKESEHHIIMTALEYATDKKRLFSIMDKGFKIILHKDDVSERTIQRQPRFEQKKSAQVAQLPITESSSSDSSLLSLPGIQKIRAKMNKGQQKLYDFLVTHDGNFYTKDNLAIMLGYSSPDALRVSCKIGEMVSNNWITTNKQGKETTYGTALRARIA